MLAVIIPYFKIAFFEDTLQSLANQTDQRFKVYVGDDSSPEDCNYLLEKYKEKFNFVYHRFETNLGSISMTKHWDRCISLSSEEEWLMILGDDDSLGEKCVESFYKMLEDDKNISFKVIRFSSRVYNYSNKSISKIYRHPEIEKASDFYYRRFTDITRSSLSEYVFKRSVYLDKGFVDYNLGWHADDRAWIDFSDFNEIYSINDAFVTVGLSNKNISRRGYKTNEKDDASYMFHTYVLKKYFLKIKRRQIYKLLLMYEQLVYRNKKQGFNFFIKMLIMFNLKFYPIGSVKFVRRYFIQKYKKNQCL